jgi:1-phosphatidylinositol phosphodiesterase
MLFPLLLIMLFASTKQFTGVKEKDAPHWMSFLPDDKKLIFINIPGAHDTAANLMHPLGESMARTQNKTIPELLRLGVRKVDIRVAPREVLDGDEEDSDLSTYHGMFECYYVDENNVTKNLTFKHIILDIKNFLEEYPTETVIIWTQSEKGDDSDNLNRAIELFDKYVGDIFVKYNKDLTLGEVRGKIVSTVYKTGESSYHYGLDGVTDLTEIHRKFIDDYYNTWEVTGELKTEEVLEFFRTYNITLEEAENDYQTDNAKYPFCYSVACTGEHQSILPFPKKQAEVVNPFILNYEFKRFNYYGWIEMDYVNFKLCKKFIDSNL